jgi:hypothetical protein
MGRVRRSRKLVLHPVKELGIPLEVKTAKTGIVLRLIPAGTFTMGSPSNETDCACQGPIGDERIIMFKSGFLDWFMQVKKARRKVRFFLR